MKSIPMCFTLNIITMGSAVMAVVSLHAGALADQHRHRSLLRLSRGTQSSSSGSYGSGRGFALGISLRDNSSSPVEPIKPLLELSSGNTGGSFIMPPHPVFDKAAPKYVSALTGNAAYLHCLVHNLSNKSVSWIRQRDLHILTVGLYTYTNDERYEVIHSPGSLDWILKIKYAQVRDSGKYECQLSTKPVRAYTVHLQVFAPEAEILGGQDMHVDRGSTINLTCVIAHSPQPPAYIFWYHNGQVVNYESPRGGREVFTKHNNSTTAYLLIKNAEPEDKGNYTCAPSNTHPSSIRVHIHHGETPAAMQTNGGRNLLASTRHNNLYIICLGILMVLPCFYLESACLFSNCLYTEGGS